MGGSNSSTRKVVIENEAEPGVVTITESALLKLNDSAIIAGDKIAATAEPTDSSLDGDREAEAKIKEIEEFYINKLNMMESRHNQIYENAQAQFDNAYEEISKKFTNSFFGSSRVCPDLQEKVFQCYKQNHRQPLKCSDEARAYLACVKNSRLKRISVLKEAELNATHSEPEPAV